MVLGSVMTRGPCSQSATVIAVFVHVRNSRLVHGNTQYQKRRLSSKGLANMQKKNKMCGGVSQTADAMNSLLLDA